MNVLKLRFGEFSGEWEEKTLGKISKDGGKYGLNAPAILYNEKLPTYIRITDIDKNGKFTTKNKTSVNYKGNNKYYLKEGDILLARTGASVGKSYLYNSNDGEMVYAGYLIKFSIDSLKTNPYFVYINLNIQRYWSYIKVMSLRSGQPGINAKEYAKFHINIPTLQEQEKIADFLTTFDERIETQQQIIQSLQQQKKGVMQKIFSQEIRFKDDNGKDYPNWEEKMLGEVVKLQGGYAFKSNEFLKVGIPIIRISDINNNIIRINERTVYYKKINIDDKFIIKKDDLLIAMSGATTGKIGTYLFKEDAYINQRVGKFISISDKYIYYNILKYIISLKSLKTQLKAKLVVGAQPNISCTDIDSLNIKLPILKEQEKIANFLTIFDEKIQTENQILTHMQNSKKGLLQQMFC